MTSLSEGQLEHFRQLLLEKKNNIETQLGAFAKKSDAIKNDYQTQFEQIGDSEEENADEVANYADNLGIEHQLEDNLREIDAALERMDKGTYGLCENCHQPMSPERLEAMPEATLCIKCE